MIRAEVLRAMASAGATTDMLIAAVEADQRASAAADEARRAAKRSSNAERQARKRAKDKTSVTKVTRDSALQAVTERDTVPPTASPLDITQPPITTPSETPSLPSEAPAPLVAEPVGSVWPRDGFSRFYAAFPRHQGRALAETAWTKLQRQAGVTFDAVMAGVDRLVRSDPDPQFVPHPATWLNQRRWEDEPVPAARPRAGPPARKSNVSLLLDAHRDRHYAPAEPEIFEPTAIADQRRVDHGRSDHEPARGDPGEPSAVCDFQVRRARPW